MRPSLIVALACSGVLADPQVRDEFEPVTIEVIELPPAPELVQPEPEPEPVLVVPAPVVAAPTRCLADPRCRGMRITGVAIGVLGLAAVGTGLGLVTRDDRVIPETPAFVTSTHPPGLVVLTLGVGVTLTAVLVVVAGGSRASAPTRRARLDGLVLRF